MKSTISILLFLALPFAINGAKKVPEYFTEEVKELNALAEKGTEINRALLLKKDGFLGEGSFGFVYEGTIKTANRSVAIKFVKDVHIERCEGEFAIYCYLRAYENESVEIYGIPAVYYYDRWENYILMAFTKFDMNLLDVANGVRSFGENDLDILILLRDFVFQSKYMHSHGVRHDDLKPENIMLRGHRSFLIDFNLSSKMMEDKLGGTLNFKSKRLGTEEIRRPIDDYESFIYIISDIMRKNWFKPEYDDNESRKNNLRNNGTEKIIKAFAEEVFTDYASKRFPNYKYLEKIISEEIKQMHPNGVPKFSWVATDAETSPARNIDDIREPNLINFNEFVYPSIGRSPSRQLTQTSMPTRKRSSKKLFGCCSKQQSD